MKLRAHFITLVIVTLIPVLIFTAVVVILFSRQQMAAQEKSLVDVAQAYSLNIDRELSSWIRALQALSTSKHLESKDLRQFYDQAQRVAQANPSWENLVVIDPLAQEVMNLRIPYGTPLPRAGNSILVRQILETGQPAISDLFTGRVTRKPMLAAGVPVIRDGKVRYILASSLTPGFLGELLSQQKPAAGWIVTVIDKNKIIVARNQNFDKFFGQPATPLFTAKSRTALTGSFDGVTLDGVKVATGFRRSELSGWTVGIGLPAEILEAPIRRSLTQITIGGILLILLGIALAIAYSHRIARPIAAISASAKAIARGETVQTVHASIVEIDDVARALEDAALTREQAERSLRDSEERYKMALEAGNIGTWHWNIATKERIWSEKYRQMLGVAPHTPVSDKVFFDAVHPDDRDRVRSAVLRALEKNEPFEQEYRLIRPDGSTRWLLGKGRGHYDAAGNPVSMEGVVLDITERKQAEDRLRASDQLLRKQYAELEHLYKTTPVGLALMDHELRFVRINDLLAEINGKPAAQHIGRTLREVVPGIAEGVESVYRRVFETGEPVLNVEIHGTTPAASEFERDWLASFHPLRMDDGTLHGVCAVVQDITERKQAREKLVAAEKRFRALIEHNSNGIVLFDVDATIQYVSPSTTLISGYSPEELIGLSSVGFIHADDQKTIMDAFAALRQNSAASQMFQFRYYHKNGSWRWLEVILTNLLDEPAVRAIVGNYRDITERKQAEERLRASEEKYRQLFENEPECVKVITADGTFQEINLAGLRMIEADSAEQVIGRQPDLVIVPEHREAFAALNQRVFSGQTGTIEFEIIGLKGKRRWLETHAAPLRDTGGKVAALLGVTRDISDQKQAEQALQARYKELQWLQEISQTILASDDLKIMAEIILEKALLVSACDSGIVRLMNKTTGTMETLAGQGYRNPQILSRHNRSLQDFKSQRLRQVLAFKRAVVLPRIENEIGMMIYKEEGIQSLILVPVLAGDSVLGLLQVGSRTQRRFAPDLINLLETLGSNFGIAVQKSKLLEETVATQTQLQELARQLVEAQEVERRNIARELHDEIGQILTGLKFTVALAAQSEANFAKTTLDDAVGVIDDLIGRVRDLSLRFRPAMLDDLGLLPALLWYFQNYTAQTGIQARFSHLGLEKRFGPELETAAYRIIQEALTNVARHARVKEAHVRCWANESTLQIEIEDHGVGFDQKTTMTKTTGLSGMGERVLSLGGHFKLESVPGVGTLVVTEFSLEDAKRDAI